MNGIDASTRTQFRILREIDGLFRRAGIRCWLRGGWALDFLQGRITRSHADIDLVTWKRHARRVRQLLTQNGCRIEHGGIPHTQMNFSKAGQDISVVFMTRDRQGRVVTAGIEDWRFHPRALTVPPQRIEDLALRVLSPHELLWEKESYQKSTGRSMRRKDRQSMAVLREIVASRS